MWIIDWLPFWIFHLVVLLGVGGLIASQFFSFIPFVSTYTTPIRILSIIALVFGVYMEGGISNQQKWEARVAELEKQVLITEQQSKDANSKIAVVVKEKIKYVQETQVLIKEHIKNVEQKLDKTCTVDPEAIIILNEAAKNPGVKK